MNEYYSRWLKNCRPKNIDIIMGIDEHDIKQRNNTKYYEARVLQNRSKKNNFTFKKICII